MNTRQKYAGGAKSAPSSEPTAQNKPQTAQQRRQRALELIQEYTDILQSEDEKLLEIASDLVTFTQDRHPVTVICNLLEYWLLHENTALVSDWNRERVQGALEAIAIIHHLHVLTNSIHYFRGELMDLRKEVGREG